MPIQQSRLANGVHVISHHVPGARSAAMGLWLLNGSRHETPEQHGWAHLLEHLFFKGCGSRDAAAIARLTDRWGGQVNAFTGRELTVLHGLVPAPRLGELAELLIDMVLDPRFDAADLHVEQGVVLQELAGIEDSPEEAVEVRAVEQAWPEHPMGRDILGTAASIRAASVDGLQAYRRAQLRGQRLAVIAVGAVDHQDLLAASAPLATLPPGARPRVAAPRFTGGRQREQRAGGQAHLLWAMPAPAGNAAALPVATLADHILGGGVSSRLFMTLRERLGLVYDIRSSLEIYSDSGLWLIQTACEPDAAARCEAAVEEIVRELWAGGPSAQELEDARDHVASVLALEHDALEAHMEHLAREHFYLGHHLDARARLAELQAVSTEAVRDLLQQSWEQRLHLAWTP